MSSRAAAVLAAALLLVAAARGPLVAATFGQPISNDDALVLLMARATAGGDPATGFWNQPYGGALDAWLLAPFARWVPPHPLFRAYQALCALGLAAVVALLARRAAGRDAGAAALLLAAAGPPYLALLGAVGLPPYLVAPLLLAPLAVLSLRYADGDEPAPAALAFGAGLLAGLDTWNTLLAGPAAAGLVAGAVLARRDRRWVKPAVGMVAGFVAGLAPMLLAARSDAVESVAGLRPIASWPSATGDLARAAAGLFGVAPPLVIDGPMRAAVPLLLQVLLVTALVVAVACGARRRTTWPLLLWSLACAAAFVAGARGRGDRVRYLLLAAPPLVAAAGVGLSALWIRRRVAAAAVALAIVLPWTVGAWRVAAAWRDPQQAPRYWGAVDLQPAAGTLAGLGVRSAYATNQIAARLAVTSTDDLRATPAWNERFPGHPLEWRDEVDLDPRTAWVLHDEISRGMPRAGAFRAMLGALGGRWKETRAGAMTVFHAFQPAWDERRPLPARVAPAAGDHDPATRETAPLVEATLEGTATVDALVLVTADDLPEGCALRVDGVTRPVPSQRNAFQWANGAPRVGRQTLRSIPIHAPVRVLTLGCPESIAVAEIFVYGRSTPQPETGAAAAEDALRLAREHRWTEAAARWRDAARLEPHRASYHAAVLRCERHAASGRALEDGLRPGSAAQ